MAQTDRQTDKASHWKSAIFDVSGSSNWEKLDTLPSFVKRLHRKKEICPSTGNPHYQIHVECNRQVRLTQMTGWIKHTKWSAVLGADHISNSIAYISKAETTAPGAKVEVVQGEKYLRIHELLMVLGRSFPFRPLSDYNGIDAFKKYETQFLFRNASREIVSRDLVWMDKLSNPVIEKSWNYYFQEILEKVYGEATESSFIIEEDSISLDGYSFLD